MAMTGDASLTADEIAELRKLLEIERIRKVRVLYTQLMDGREIDALVDLLTEDAVCEFGPFGTWHGRAEIRAQWRDVFKDVVPFGGLHFNSNMWIELTSPATATSRSYLQSVHNDAGPRTNPVAV